MLTHKVTFLAQDTVKPRRRNLQHVGVWNNVLPIENLLQPLTETLTVVNVDATRLVDVNAQIVVSLFHVLDIHQLDGGRIRQQSAHHLLDALLDLRAHALPLLIRNERVGFHPLFPKLK